MSDSSVQGKVQHDQVTHSAGNPKTATLQQRSVDLNQSSATCNKVMMAVGVVFILAAIAFGVYGGLNNSPMEQLTPITAGLAVIGIALLTIGCCRLKGAEVQPDPSRIRQLKNRLINLNQQRVAMPDEFMNLSHDTITRMPLRSYYVKGKSIIIKEKRGTYGGVLDDAGDDSDMKCYLAHLQSMNYWRVV